MKKFVWLLGFIGIITLGFGGIKLITRAVDYNSNPSNVSYSQDGQVAVWVQGGSIQVNLSTNGKQKSFSHSGGVSKHTTDLKVKSGDSVKVEVLDGSGKALGWQAPSGTMCGSGAPLPPTGGRSPGSYAKIDIADFIDDVNADGQKLESIQCWADYPEWSGDQDFNDFFMIFSYGDEGSDDPDDPDDPEEKKAKVQIRKFKDNDSDGVWDTGETSTGEVFEFEYQVNNEETKSYSTDPGSGRGLFIEVNSGDQVTVTEKQKAGWRSTTGLTQSVTVSNNETYFLDFGNVPDRIEVDPPSITPETGICSKC